MATCAACSERRYQCFEALIESRAKPWPLPVGRASEARRRRDDVLATAHGYRLAELRKRAGLTQAQLAESMGVTKQRVSQIEHGRADSLGLDVLMRYATALGGRLRVVIDYGDEISTVA